MNNWTYKSLTIFGKITVVKTFVLSKISHIAKLLLIPTPKKCKIFDRIINNFICGKNSEGKTKNSFVPAEILHDPKEVCGLGIQNTHDFCSALKVPWLRRLQKDSTWHSIHMEDLGAGKLIFDPFTMNESQLIEAWREVYSNIMKCKNNLIIMDCPTVPHIRQGLFN